MKFNFLTHKLMTNNLFKSVVASAVIATGVSAETPNLNSATSVAVRESSIDFNQNITKIDTQIALMQNKIDILNQKSDLSTKERRERLYLKRDLQKLTAEKVVIKQSEGQQLDKKVAIRTEIKKDIDNTIDKSENRIKKKKENLAILDATLKKHKEQLSIAEHKLEALNRISKIMKK